MVYTQYMESTHITRNTEDGQEILTVDPVGDAVHVIWYVNAVEICEARMTTNQAQGAVEAFLAR